MIMFCPFEKVLALYAVGSVVCSTGSMIEPVLRCIYSF